MAGEISTSTEATDYEQNAAVVDYKRFFRVFYQSRGAVRILIVSTLLALGFGSVIGLLPATLSDRYARIHHGFRDSCSDLDPKPSACQAGSDEAQYAAAWSNVAMSLMTLVSNPVVGSISDTHGRRPIILLSLALSCIPSAVFVLLQYLPNMSPAWYYASNGLTGAVNYISITFAALSDVVPVDMRAPSYGVLLSGFFGAYALSPFMAIFLDNDSAVGLVSFGFIVSAFLLAVFFLPETISTADVPNSSGLPSDAVLPDQSLSENGADAPDSSSTLAWLIDTTTRPIREVSILNRDWSIRMLTVGSFFAAAVFASDATLVVYYVEEEMNVHKEDIAGMMLALGIAGIVVQGVLLQPLISCLGEKSLLVASFACGTMHNFLYGVARSKGTIYLALILSQFTKINFPLLSSQASKHVEETEQGRIQGALFATNALANALGPLSMEYIYKNTKTWLGPGFMFIYAAGLYATGTCIVSFIPSRRPPPRRVMNGANSADSEDNTADTPNLEEPLLNADESDISG